MNPLTVGDKMPAFRGATSDGSFSSDMLNGSWAVLYFYPKDDTPGCTIEACAFRDNLPKFKRLDARVFGISRDSVKAHAKFAEKYELPFTLIADEDGSICAAFGTWGEKTLFGKKYMGIERATFLIDAQGIIRHIWRKVKVSGHVEDVMSKIKDFKSNR